MSTTRPHCVDIHSRQRTVATRRPETTRPLKWLCHSSSPLKTATAFISTHFGVLPTTGTTHPNGHKTRFAPKRRATLHRSPNKRLPKLDLTTKYQDGVSLNFDVLQFGQCFRPGSSPVGFGFVALDSGDLGL